MASAAAASIGGRSSSILRSILRTSTRQGIGSALRSNPVFRQARTPLTSTPFPSSRGLLRRELSCLPYYSAVASACLVSKLPNDATTSSEGHFDKLRELPSLSHGTIVVVTTWFLDAQLLQSMNNLKVFQRRALFAFIGRFINYLSPI